MIKSFLYLVSEVIVKQASEIKFEPKRSFAITSLDWNEKYAWNCKV